MKVKTFPLVMTTDEHMRIKTEARKRGETMRDFIFNAIEKSIMEATNERHDQKANSKIKS